MIVLHQSAKENSFLNCLLELPGETAVLCFLNIFGTWDFGDSVGLEIGEVGSEGVEE